LSGLSKHNKKLEVPEAPAGAPRKLRELADAIDGFSILYRECKNADSKAIYLAHYTEAMDEYEILLLQYYPQNPSPSHSPRAQNLHP
jgi:hypothetical protein